MSVIKRYKSDRLKIAVCESRDAMGFHAAKKASECIRNLLQKKAEINMVFAAAPSQNETLRYLVEEKGIDWNRVNAFHLDEYVGLKMCHAQTFNAYLDEHIFKKVNFKSVNRLMGWVDDIAAECERYSGLLKSHHLDVVMLGIGENGHIAFNDPWVANFRDPELVKVVKLDEVCRQQQVNDGCFNKLDDVPRFALSLTIPALISADHLFCSVPGKSKRKAVTGTVWGAISEEIPATAMRLHQDANLFCDLESGADLLG